MGYRLCPEDCGEVLTNNVYENVITQQALFSMIEIGQQSRSAWAAVTKYGHLGSLYSKHYLTVPETGESKIKVLVHFSPGEGSLVDGFLFLCPHVVERKSKLCGFFL